MFALYVAETDEKWRIHRKILEVKERRKRGVSFFFEKITHLKRRNDTQNTSVFLRVRMIMCNFATDFKLKIKTILVEGDLVALRQKFFIVQKQVLMK